MTTKWKIMAGFVVMVILLGTVSFLGYSGIQTSSNSFVEYRRLARLNVACSDMETALNTAMQNLYAYLDTQDEDQIRAAKENAAKFLELVKANEGYATSQNTRDGFTYLKEEIVKTGQLVDTVHKSLSNNAAQYDNTVRPSLRAVVAQIVKMSKQAHETQNMEALAAFAPLWNDVSYFMSAISRFAYTHTEENATIVKNYLKNINVSLNRLAETLPSALGQKDMADLSGEVKTLSDASDTMEVLSSDLRTSIAAINTFLAGALKRTSSLNTTINDQMIIYGPQTLASNESVQRFTLIVGSVGLLIGVGIALVIVIGIVRVLSNLSAFAEAIARGDFTHQVRIKEKGEIGSVIGAMRNIPHVLSDIISAANNLAVHIRLGQLRERYDTKSLPGEFSGLGLAVNTVGDAYTELIDAIPIPVLACDKNHHILFSNKSGLAVMGKDAVGANYMDCMNVQDRTLDNNPGKKIAASGGHASTQEMTISPQGKRMEVSLTTIPALDMNGQLAGFFTLVTDLTEIKEKQGLMLRIANDASSISDRVAAASEELSAQMEQISHGARIQHERVEATATAMNEMNATVLEVAKNAGQASEQSDGTRKQAEDGATLVNKVVNAINKVNVVGNTLHDNMQELGEQAHGIGGVMNVISDIADQTNLLALNAAIEAARAGEAGRGFAVVADEVRKLAEKTMAATQEVGGNITAIQNSARINIEEVELAVKSVGEATELANSSGLALSEIVNLAAVNSSVVASIAAAAEQQSATSEEINGAIAEINRITSETTDGVSQSSDAVQELSRMAQELRRVMEGLR